MKYITCSGALTRAVRKFVALHVRKFFPSLSTDEDNMSAKGQQSSKIREHLFLK